jgi:hypothetical protein
LLQPIARGNLIVIDERNEVGPADRDVQAPVTRNRHPRLWLYGVLNAQLSFGTVLPAHVFTGAVLFVLDDDNRY